MTSFSVSPVQGFAGQTGDGAPNFIQFESQGVPLGGPDADTVDFGAGLAATRGVGENENVVSVEPALGWRDVYGDDQILATDANASIYLRGTSGEQLLTLEYGQLIAGQSVLIVQQDDAQGRIAVGSGMTLLYRTAFQPLTAGKGATLTLIMKTADFAVLCGDMALAA